MQDRACQILVREIEIFASNRLHNNHDLFCGLNSGYTFIKYIYRRHQMYIQILKTAV